MIFAETGHPVFDTNSHTLYRVSNPHSGHPSQKRHTMKTPARKTAPRAKKPRKTVTFLHKSTCATCRKARRFMEKRGYHLNYRDLVKDRLSASELQNLIGKHDHEDFLNPRSEIFQK